MRPFKHTFKEKDLWRGWLKNGQSVELSRCRYGWDFGAGVHVHSNENDMGDRMLFLKFWRWTLVIPMGIVPHPWPPMDGPQWSAYASKEFGMTLNWGLWRKSFDWPWDLVTIAYEANLPDGTWRDLSWKERDQEYTETHHYTYTLRSGEVQHRNATISKRRHVLCRRAFKRIGWPCWVKESIDVRFDGEVGERAGSWKGGTIGCSYELRSGETMLDCLRRMEAERRFN